MPRSKIQILRAFPYLRSAQDRLDGRDVGAVAVQRFIAERKTFTVDDQALTIRAQSGRWSRE